MKVQTLYYTGSSRQLRKFRHKLLKAGLAANSCFGNFEKGMQAVVVFTDIEFIFAFRIPEPVFTGPGWNLKYKGREYKAALTALNIPV